MITYLEKPLKDAFSALGQSSVRVRLEAMLCGYGTNLDFLDFWLQKKETEVTAALCRFSGELWLLAKENADFEELSAFCKVMAPTVLTDEQTASRLGDGEKESFYELVLETAEKSPCEEVNLKRLYEMLMEGADGDILIPDKDEWYADVSHRIRHSVASAVLTENAAALAGFVSDEGALITGVSVKPSARGKGFGKQAVMELAGGLAPRKIYAEAGEETRGFYLSLGFVISNRLVRIKS